MYNLAGDGPGHVTSLCVGVGQNIFSTTLKNARYWSKHNQEKKKMVNNIYGQAIRDMEKMRVEEKIDHIKNAIPDDLYKVLTEEWHRFVKSSVKKGQGERELVEFDYFFELFMKFPH